MQQMHPRTAALLAREHVTQRTPEWFAVRRELLTASDAASALDIKPYASYRGSSRGELLRRKVANAPIANMFVVHGQKYEDEARDWAAAAMGETVEEIGLVRHATLPWLAASPDGVTHSGKLMEIKCPLKRQIQPGQVPHHYWPQVQVQMEVCDIDQTIFVQYKPACLSHDGRALIDIVVVQRDRHWFDQHRDALHAFWREYMAARGSSTVPAAGGGSGNDGAPGVCLVRDDLYAASAPTSSPTASDMTADAADFLM